MAFTCLDASATGLSALTTNLNVIANNLANANTDGFKASRVNFQDLMYLEQRQPGLENTVGDLNPTGLYTGVGTRVGAHGYGSQFASLAAHMKLPAAAQETESHVVGLPAPPG